MRSRNLKPGLFKNELLGSADPLLTLLFEGLWCSADREGRLEDRPLRLCAEVFPYRRAITERRLDGMLQWLHDRKFITRYEVDGDAYIQVLEFKRHQTPHVKEGPSRIPELRLGKPRARTGPAPDKHQTNTGPVRSDSGLLTPDSGLLTPCTPESGARTGPDPVREIVLTEIEHHERFVRIMALYPEYTGKQAPIATELACRTLINRGEATWDVLEAGVVRLAAFVTAGGYSEPKYVPIPLNFFKDQEKFWSQPWTPPAPPPTKADKRLAGNIDAAEQAKRELFEGAQ